MVPSPTGDDGSHTRRDRRTFLRTLAAAGLGSAVGTGTVAGQSDGSTLGSYRRALRGYLTEEEGLPEGRFVYGTSETAALDAFSLQGGSAGSETRFDVDADVPITAADRVEIDENPENAYSYTYKANITGGASDGEGGTDGTIESGDVLLAVAYLRSPNKVTPADRPTTNAGFKFQYTNPDGSTGYSQNYATGTTQVNPGTEWERYFFPIEVTEKPDGSEFQPYTEFWTGYSEQTIEFGGVALIDYSNTDVTVGDLPTTAVDYEYPGRAEDAAWRQDARQRIEEIRKADLEVNVADADGNSLEGAEVEVAMEEHAFGFGGEFALSQVGDRWDTDVAETYRRKHLENFNKGVLTNALKVTPWNGGWGEAVGAQSARRALQWFLDNDVPTRGHALVWEEYDWMNIDASLSDERINELVKERIRNRASEFQGDLPEWDLHNHPIWQPNIREDIGRDAALEWWETGHEAAPDAQMYVNEMNIIAGNSYRDPYDEFISWLMESDAGVGGIGFMGHFNIDGLTPPEELLSVFDRFGEHGVPLQITEFDVQISSRDNEKQVEAQADYVRDVLTAAFSHEALEGVMSWCFWDEDGAPKRYYSADWTLRQHGEEYQRLVFDEWWTDESGTTDAEGAYATTGFKGEYEITASVDGETKTRSATLGDGGASVELQFENAESEATTEDGSNGSDGTESDGTATEAGNDTSTTASGGTPGFGIGTGGVALGAAAVAKRLSAADEE